MSPLQGGTRIFDIYVSLFVFKILDKNWTRFIEF